MKIPESILWHPVQFICGHPLDVGVDSDEGNASQRLDSFLTVASAFPCPQCGSATGRPERPATETPRYLVANDVWYRSISDPQRLTLARLNARVAAAKRASKESPVPEWAQGPRRGRGVI